MLTMDEITIIKMYADLNPDRNAILSALKESLPHIENKEILETVKSTIRKLNAMPNECFKNIDFSKAMDTSEFAE